MVLLCAAPALPADLLTLFSTTDPFLSNSPIIILYGPPSGSSGNLATSARIQSHVFTAVGLQSYPRLAISPSSSLYGAVNCLSREDQGDEVSRALAYALFKYFTDLPELAKQAWIKRSRSADYQTQNLFDESHAAFLAGRMTRLENTRDVIKDLEASLAEHTLSYLDIDIILPPNSIKTTCRDPAVEQGNETSSDIDHLRYGQYAPLVRLFGESSFLPTSKIRRAPSRPTALNRSLLFTRTQKENLRRELCELLDTEESYVGKMDGIVHGIAADFRSKASITPGNTSPTHKAMAALFPASLDDILQINSGFLEATRKIIDETENSAIEDIKSTDQSSTFQQNAPLTHDPTGIIAISSCLLEWFPRFQICYTDYIKAHTEFGQQMKVFMSATASPLAKLAQDTSEQMLMSLLIEPVQRLPRYSLYIDNMIKQLPFKHPAITSLMKARDLIAEACSQDTAFSQSKMADRLKRIVVSWPRNFDPNCRLITAADMIELRAPYSLDSDAVKADRFICLLFAGCVVFLKKTSPTSISARGIMSEIESSSKKSSTMQQPPDLIYTGHRLLDSFELHETLNGIASMFIPTQAAQEFVIYLLEGPYEGRASRWTKDVTKARVESRFPEGVRDNPKWEARDLGSGEFGLGVFASICEHDQYQQSLKSKSTTIKVLVDPRQESVLEEESNTVVSVVPAGQGFYHLSIRTPNERQTRDMVTVAEFMPILLRRLSNIAQMRCQIRNPLLTIAILQHHENILGSLKLPIDQPLPERSSSKSKVSRPHSPVKALSKFFGSSSINTNTTKESPAAKLTLAARPAIGPKTFVSVHKDCQNKSSPVKATLSARETQIGKSAIQLTEDVLATYMLAMHARKGNVVGRQLLNRTTADEAVVNELYNTLIEDAGNHEAAAQAPVDVLFAAFERFLKVGAWRNNFGLLLSQRCIEELQLNSERLSPYDYEEYLSKVLFELSPQNRRAFKEVLILLMDLLDGTSNDGDRGALMSMFTDILIPQGNNPHDFMPLVDRLVAEHDVLLANTSSATTSTQNSVASRATDTTQATSLSSKTSSFSKRLGAGLLRTWSKPTRIVDSTPLLMRHKSADLSSIVSLRPLSATQSVASSSRPTTSSSRPMSRDRPLVVGASAENYRPVSWYPKEPKNAAETTLLSTPGRKRRSSLSDITDLPLPNTSPFWASPSTRRFETPKKTGTSCVRLGSPIALVKEDKQTLKPTRHLPSTPELLKKVSGSQSLHPLNPLLQNPPTPKGVLSERPGSGNTPPPLLLSRRTAGSPKKLRKTTPQIIEERIQVQKLAVKSAQVSTQTDISDLTKDLKDLGLDRRTADDFKTRLSVSDSKFHNINYTLAQQMNMLEVDMSAALRASERKVKELDNLLRQSNAENDALYKRNNKELERIYARVTSGGEQESEFPRKIAESQEEASQWMKEAKKLKRENAILKARLGAAEE